MPNLAPAEGAILEEILDASHPLWHDGLERRRFGLFYEAQRRTSWGRSHLSRTALVDGPELLASAKEYAFDAFLAGRPVRALGIGALFTQPRHRRQGHARELLDQLILRASSRGFDLVLLFSGIGTAYYMRAGFVPVPTFDRYLDVAQPARYGAPATLIRAGEDRDLVQIAEMGRSRSASCRFHLDRDRDLIAYAISKRRLHAGLGAPGVSEMQFFATEEGTRCVAYVVVSATGGEWTIDECGDRDPAGARVGAILQGLIARDPGAGRPRIRASLPPGFLPPQVGIARSEPSAELMMIRPLSRAGEAAAALGADDVLYWRGDLF